MNKDRHIISEIRGFFAESDNTKAIQGVMNVMDHIQITQRQTGFAKSENCKFTAEQIFRLAVLFPFFPIKNVRNYTKSMLGQLFMRLDLGLRAHPDALVVAEVHEVHPDVGVLVLANLLRAVRIEVTERALLTLVLDHTLGAERALELEGAVDGVVLGHVMLDLLRGEVVVGRVTHLLEGHHALDLEAVNYFLNEWDGIEAIATGGDYAWDNNLIERINRYISLSRKNSLFFGSHAGAERGAIFYSLACSCRLRRINFFEYLADVLNTVAAMPNGTPPDAFRELLPDRWTKLEQGV